MKKIIFSVILFFCFISAQELTWDKISFGIIGQQVTPSANMHKYWGKTISGGALINYKLTDSFSYEIWVTYGEFTPEKSNISNLPKIEYLSVPFGVRYKTTVLNNSFLTLFAGLENNNFDFEESEQRDENLNESEMGVFLSAGYRFNIYNNISAEIFAKYETIFSEPENIKLFNVGLILVFE